MGFNDLMIIEPTSVSALDRMDEVDAGARERMAGRLQARLRATVDPGINLKSAVQAQAIRVTSSEEGFSVRREDQARIVKGPDEQDAPEESDPNQVDDVDALFEMGSGVPSMVNGKLVFRTISEEALFGQQKRAVYHQQIDQTVTATLRDELLESFEESFEDLARRSPPGVR